MLYMRYSSSYGSSLLRQSARAARDRLWQHSQWLSEKVKQQTEWACDFGFALLHNTE